MSLSDSLLQQRPSSIISWKDYTLKEILNGYAKPERVTQSNNKTFMFHALPQRQYRRQVGAPVRSRLGRKLSMSQDLPGGQTVVTQDPNPTCFATQTYAKKNSLYENGNSIVTCTPTSSTSNSGSLTQEFNALRRVRSAGSNTTIRYSSKLNYYKSTNDPVKQRSSGAQPYYFSNKQYLYSRRETYVQNMTAQPCNTPLPGTCSVTPTVKLNNSKFRVQGGVDSSDVILRKKYNTIQKAANSYVGIYGSGTSITNALAYGNTQTGQAITAKSVVGYPMPRPLCRATGKC